ncbi:MAG: transposase family protein, partial [Myxococcaceae bacterium]
FGRFLDLSKGTPSEDTYRRVFEALDPEAFERSFIGWTGSIAELKPGETVGIDGKTVRNSGRNQRRCAPFTMADPRDHVRAISAFTLGEMRRKETDRAQGPPAAHARACYRQARGVQATARR